MGVVDLKRKMEYTLFSMDYAAAHDILTYGTKGIYVRNPNTISVV